jgi:hypothetical protein
MSKLAGTPENGALIWLDYDQDALNRQYDQRVLVPDAERYIARHARQSAPP